MTTPPTEVAESFSAEALPPAADVAAAERLAAARAQYAHVLSHVELASRAADQLLSEKQLWHLIARTASPDWSQAYNRLLRAEREAAWLADGDNKPLGAIGMALVGEEMVLSEQELDEAQSLFTLMHEQLRHDEGLRLLLEDLVARQRSLEVSMGISEGVLNLTRELDFDREEDEGPSPLPALSAAFGSFARKIGSLARATMAPRKPQV